MIDKKLLRDDKEYKKILESERKRYRDGLNVIEARELYEKHIKIQFNIDNLQKDLNKVTNNLKEIYKRKENKNFDLKTFEIEEIKAEKTKIENNLDFKNKENDAIKAKMYKRLKLIGNVLLEDVVFSKDEDDNKIISENGKYEEKKFEILPHNILMEKLDGVDMVRGAKIVGHRGYFLKNDLVQLEYALAKYAMDFAVENVEIAQLIQTPTFMRKEIMEKTCQLSDFDEQLYKVNDTHYLIATSEQPISALYMDERLTDEDLPKFYIGESLCYRKEAGAHGKDNLGIFRIHQFKKIEQFIICAPEESDTFHKKMVNLTERFLVNLGFKIRTVSIVSGEMNDAAAIKYDIEAYFPSENKFRELASVSNCTDYQSRDLEIRYGYQKIDNKKTYVHMLNGTLCPVQRAMCGLLEICQTEKGIIIPEVLRKYMGKDFLEFKN